MAPRPTDPRQKELTHKELQRRFVLARDSRRVYEGDWWMNIAFLQNEQHVQWDRRQHRLIVLDADEERTVTNYLMKLTRIERAKILKTQPVPTVLPATEDEDDHVAARLLEAYFDEQMFQWQHPALMRQAAYWIVATGNAFFKWPWDWRDANAQNLAIVPPFEAYPDPYPRRFKDARWVIHEQFLNPEEAWDRYADVSGADTSHLRPSKPERLGSGEARVYADLFGGPGGEGAEGITVREYWERASRWRPDGAYIVFTKSGIVWEGPNPYEHGRLPFTHALHIERSSSMWGASIIDYERDLQIAANRREAQIDSAMALSQPKWYLPATLKLDADPDARPGQVLRGMDDSNPNLEPHVIQAQFADAALLNEPERLRALMEDIAGQHEVSQGGVPGRVDAASAIQLLQETDDAVMKDTIHSLEEALEQGFYMVAANARQFGDEDTLVRSYDHFGNLEVLHLATSGINLEARIRMKTASALPSSVAGKFDRILNLVQYQIISPDFARDLLDLSTENPSLDPAMMARRVAYRENLMMRGIKDPRDPLGPGPMIPEWFEDHDAHLFEHYKDMNTEDFKRRTPAARAHIEWHCLWHEYWRKVMYGNQALVMAIQQGAQPPPGAPLEMPLYEAGLALPPGMMTTPPGTPPPPPGSSEALAVQSGVSPPGLPAPSPTGGAPGVPQPDGQGPAPVSGGPPVPTGNI